MSTRYQEILDLEHFKEPTPIQKAILNRKDPNRDFIGISSTGSGKSHAFFMAVFERIDPQLQKIQAVISAPTRELAYQLYRRIQPIAKHFGVHVSLCIGGTEKKESFSHTQIAIGTPGRLKDLFLDEKVLLLNQASLFIIDEADMTMEFGFLEDIDEILSHMSENTTVMVFSATIPQQIQPFLKKYLNAPETVRIETDEKYQADIHHQLIPLKHKDYSEKLKDLLPLIHPYVCLIFANTTKEAAKIAKDLRSEGYDLVELHGDLEARERQRAIREIQSQKKTWIVASDLASRGIDLDGVTHVISCGFPKDLKFYQHRSGRTGRAGRDGYAITLIAESDEPQVSSLENQGIHFERMDIRNREIVPVKKKPRRQKEDPLKEQIKKISSRKKKVKPNYRKKQRQEIDSLRRKHKRAIIRKEIQAQKKKRAIEKQRAKKSS